MKLNRVRRRRRDLQKVDRLIKLPDEVLLNILERVGTLDAIRTCVVSKRMLNLPAMLSQIDVVLSYDDLFLMNDAVADVIDKILRTRSPQIPIRKLKVRFILRLRDCISIGKSVALAMATQKLDAAEFEITTPNPYGKGCTDASRTLEHFGKKFNTFIGECPDAFAGITRLHLQNLRFGESDFSNILSTCKRLVSLCLVGCDTGIDSVLQVEHDGLVELDITFGWFRTVDLNFLPKLEQFTYDNWYCDENPLVLGFVPRLSKLNLFNIGLSDMTMVLSDLLANVPSINDLHLDFQREKIWVLPECPKLLAPVLRKLRIVNFDHLPEGCDIGWTMFILEAAPSLEELCVTVWDHRCQKEGHRSLVEKTDVKWEPSAPDLKHNNLAKLTVHGFQSDNSFTGYVRRIMEVAVNIKEVFLHDRKVSRLCHDDLEDPEIKEHLTRYPQTSEEKDLLRKKIIDGLVMVSPDVIHFRPSYYDSLPATKFI